MKRNHGILWITQAIALLENNIIFYVGLNTIVVYVTLIIIRVNQGRQLLPMWPRYGPMRLRRRAGRNRYCISGEHYKKNAQLPLKKYSCHYLLHRTYMYIIHFLLQNRTGDGHFDVSCGPECSVQQVLETILLYLSSFVMNTCISIFTLFITTLFSLQGRISTGAGQALVIKQLR